MTPMRVPALVGSDPVVIIAFDATHALCAFSDGHIDYVEHRELRVVFFRDLEIDYWLTYGGQHGETEAGSGDEMHPVAASSDAASLPRADGRGDDDVVEPAV